MRVAPGAQPAKSSDKDRSVRVAEHSKDGALEPSRCRRRHAVLLEGGFHFSEKYPRSPAATAPKKSGKQRPANAELERPRGADFD